MHFMKVRLCIKFCACKMFDIEIFKYFPLRNWVIHYNYHHHYYYANGNRTCLAPPLEKIIDLPLRESSGKVVQMRKTGAKAPSTSFLPLLISKNPMIKCRFGVARF